MDVIILSEFELIKATISQSIKSIIPKSDLLIGNPRVLSAFNNRLENNFFYSESYLKFQRPNVIFYDLDSKLHGDTFIHLGKEMLSGNVLKNKNSALVFTSTKAQFARFLKFSGLKDESDILYLPKPYSINQLNNFVKDVSFTLFK